MMKKYGKHPLATTWTDGQSSDDLYIIAHRRCAKSRTDRQKQPLEARTGLQDIGGISSTRYRGKTGARRFCCRVCTATPECAQRPCGKSCAQCAKHRTSFGE